MESRYTEPTLVSTSLPGISPQVLSMGEITYYAMVHGDWITKLGDVARYRPEVDGPPSKGPGHVTIADYKLILLFILHAFVRVNGSDATNLSEEDKRFRVEASGVLGALLMFPLAHLVKTEPAVRDFEKHVEKVFAESQVAPGVHKLSPPTNDDGLLKLAKALGLPANASTLRFLSASTSGKEPTEPND